MLFCLSVCDENQRVILDRRPHGEVLAKLKGRHWQRARRRVRRHRAMSELAHRAGRVDRRDNPR